MMKALQYDTFGAPADVVALHDVGLPGPSAGEVRLRVRRAPIHNHDLATIRGTYGIKPELPAIGGSEMCGEVEALGAGVEGVAIGTRVAAMSHATWAEFALAPAAGIVPVPASLDDDTAAQLLAMPLSALVLFDSLALAPGDWLVQNAAAGAVGRLVMRIAQRAGVNVINLVRRAASADELRSYGAQHCVVTDDAAWPTRVRAIAGEVKAAIDSVCDAQSTALHGLLSDGGEHVVFGALGTSLLRLDPGMLIFKQSRVRGFWMTKWRESARREDQVALLQRLFALAQAGELPLPVEVVCPLADARTALLAAERPGRKGKVLFAP